MLPTPSTPSLPPTIYPPSEDTYLLLDTLSSPSETSFLHALFRATSPSPLILDLGTGSGTILAFLLAHAPVIFGRADVLGLGADLNLDACAYVGRVVRGACEEARKAEAQKTVGNGQIISEEWRKDAGSGEVNGQGEGVELVAEREARTWMKRKTENAMQTGIYLGALHTSLLPSIRAGSIDVLVFNPPYVPSDAVPTYHRYDNYNSDSKSAFNAKSNSASNDKSMQFTTTPASTSTSTSTSQSTQAFERTSHLLSLSYDGGKNGMEVVDAFLADLPRVLSERGIAYLLLCQQNGVQEVMERIRGWDIGREMRDEVGEGCENGEGRRRWDGDGDGDGEAKGKWRWRAEIIGKSGKAAGWEKLVVVRIWRGWEGV